MSDDEKPRVFGRVARFGEMAWPLHTTDLGWTLRYGTPSPSDLLMAASIIDAYAALVEAPQPKRALVVRQLRAAAVAPPQ